MLIGSQLAQDLKMCVLRLASKGGSMAKPIEGTPVLKGKAAQDFVEYLRKAKPDPKKRNALEKALAFHKSVEVID